MLRAWADRARIALVCAYARQPFVRPAKRWLCAQLATSLPGLGRPCLVRTSLTLGEERLRLWVDAHSSVGLEAAMSGSYESASMNRLLALAARLGADQPTFLDVGANIGFYSVGLALAQARARVIACEPAPAAAALCGRNIAAVAQRLRERGSGIELVQAAISDRAGEALLRVSQDAGHNSLLEVENFQAQSITVRTTTIDQLCAERRITQVAVAKIYVEGAELDVLRGMSGLLARGAVSLLQWK